MTITVTERDEDHMSREARGLGMHLWDVKQEGELVGVYQSEAAALEYKEQIEHDACVHHRNAPQSLRITA